jgi:DNA-binding winged helix-turn-helix (wHTH) protein
MTLLEPDDALAFGRFVLRPRARELLADGVRLELGARAFDLLLALVRADGGLVTKEALLQEAWQGAVVEENNLHAQIVAIRRALGADRTAIVTIPGQGYRFALPLARGPQNARRSVPSLAKRLSVAVLPFLASGEAEAEPMAEGVTASLTIDLSRALMGGGVIPRATASRLRGMEARQIGAELPVRYVLDGSLAVHDSRARVQIQLLPTSADGPIWAERFDQPIGGDRLAAQDAIVGRLTRRLVVQIVLAEARRVASEPAPDADDLAIAAHAATLTSGMSAAGSATAREMLRRALALDPDHVEANATLATIEVYAVVNRHGHASRYETQLDEAEALANRALSREPGHRVALTALATVLRARGRFADAVEVVEALLTRCPGDPPGCRELGLNHLYLGNTEAAVAAFRQADLGGPDDPSRWSWTQGLGRALMQLGRDAEAERAIRITLANNANFHFGHALLAAALALRGDAVGAREAYAEFVRRVPDPAARRERRRPPVPEDRVNPAYHRQDMRMQRALQTLEDALHGRETPGSA